MGTLEFPRLRLRAPHLESLKRRIEQNLDYMQESCIGNLRRYRIGNLRRYLDLDLDEEWVIAHR